MLIHEPCKAVFAIITCAFCLLPLGAPAQNQHDQNIITVATPEPQSLNPLFAFDNFSVRIGVNLFETLLGISNDGEIYSRLADQWYVSPDAKHYQLQLRADAAWSDGTPIDAKDVVDSWLFAGAVENTALPFDINAAEFSVVESSWGGEVVDVRFPQPEPMFLYHITDHAMSVLPLHISDEVDFSEPFGFSELPDLVFSGPYQIDHFNLQSMKIRPNPQHYATEAIQNAGIDIIYVSLENEDRVLSMLRHGQADVGYMEVTTQANAASEQFDDIIRHLEWPMIEFLLFSVTNPPFDNLQIRKAASLATPQEMPESFLTSSLVVPRNSLIPDGLLPSTEHRMTPLPTFSQQEQLEQARRIMAALGYSRHNLLPVELSVNQGSINERMAMIMQSAWRQAYFDVSISVRGWDDHVQQVLINGDFQVARSGWNMGYPHPIAILQIFESGNAYNSARYSNPKFDELIAAIKTEPDPELSTTLSEQALHIMEEDYLAVPLYGVARMIIHQSHISLGGFHFGGEPRLHEISVQVT